MRNDKSEKNKINPSILKKSYYITLKNAGKRTADHFGGFTENPHYPKNMHTEDR